MAKAYRVGISRRGINAIVSALVGRGRGPANTYVLTTIGRHSGESRSTPVTLIEEGAQRFLISPYGEVGWVHNIRARPIATLRRGPGEQQVRAHAVEPEVAALILKRYLTDLEKIVKDYFDVAATDPIERFAEIVDRHPVFRIESA